MVLSFALCASLAFAQPARINNRVKSDATKDANSKFQAANVDYKASIFAKDEVLNDTLHCFTFAEDDMEGVIYGNTAKLTANDILDGEAVGGQAHTQTGDYTFWRRYSDTGYFHAHYTLDYPNLGEANNGAGYGTIGTINAMSAAGTNNGFMFMGLGEDQASAGFINAYIEFPAVQNNPDAQIIDINLRQRYINYYDTCYIDYQIGGQWYSRAINVMGIDVTVNGAAANVARYTMPFNLAQEQNIKIRVRAYSGRRGSSFGHIWAVDDIAIVSYGSTYRLDLRNAHYMQGFYGTLPEGMNFPITWGCHLYNTGISDVNTHSLTLTHLYTNAEGVEQSNTIINATQNAVPAGEVNTPHLALINERGWYADDQPFAGQQYYYMQHWLGHYTNYGTTSNNGFGGHGLPTSHTGINRFTITSQTGANNGNVSRATDTIAYYVSPEIEGTDEHPVAGYRFGFDNGLIASGSYFTPQFTDDGYVSNEGSHHMTQNYYILYRIVTGDVVPEGWVFRGMEFIPTTNLSPAELAGNRIIPLFYREVYDESGDSFNYGDVNYGIDGLAFETDVNSANDLSTGYILPGANYNGFDIEFRDDEPIRPNTAYRIGYQMAADGNFCLAGTEQLYVTTDEETGNQVYASFYENAATSKLVYPLAAEGYWEGVVSDAEAGDSYHPCNPNGEKLIENWPMMRLIVGPKPERPTKTISVTCHNTLISHASEDVCDNEVNVAVASNQYFSINGGDDHMVIDSIYVDGQLVTEYDEETGLGDENLASYEDNVLGDDDIFVRLYRLRYTYFFGGVQDDHTIEAWAHYEDWNVGIDPVAPEVSMSLVPNPATSQVKVNIAGVTGMVNMNIIDMSGRVIYNANVNAENETIVNLSNIPAGAYFVRITNDTFSKVEKLIVR